MAFVHEYHTTITAEFASMHSPEYKMMFLNLLMPYSLTLTSVVSNAELTGPVATLPMPSMQAKAEKVTRQGKVKKTRLSPRL